ncbi:ABC transporter ATP-binding protein [Alicyclobacillus tolerans]|uniref:ABC transporter ATP-binding protein n=1 Tax=Alicyclobacillus tolerans TaxID=90970 RepID=UPI003B7AF3B7
MIELSCKLPRHTFTLDIRLQIESGTVYSLFGPSAAGKSSTLHVMAGFENRMQQAYFSVDGQVLLQVGGKKTINVPSWQRNIILIEQGSLLFPHLTVKQNIYYAVNRHHQDELEKWIEEFGLAPYLDAKPKQLSGGLVQRAVLVRAFAKRPRMLLLDEAFSALDGPLRRTLQGAVMDLQKELGTTIIMVTHQLSEAQRMSDRLGILHNGKLLQEGTPEELMLHPHSWQTAKLLGYTHLLEDIRGQKFALHPNRVLLGNHPHLGPVLQGRIQRRFWYEGECRVTIKLMDRSVYPDDSNVEISVPIDTDIQPGEIQPFTTVHPPYFSHEFVISENI